MRLKENSGDYLVRPLYSRSATWSLLARTVSRRLQNISEDIIHNHCADAPSLSQHRSVSRCSGGISPVSACAHCLWFCPWAPLKSTWLCPFLHLPFIYIVYIHTCPLYTLMWPPWAFSFSSTIPALSAFLHRSHASVPLYFSWPSVGCSRMFMFSMPLWNSELDTIPRVAWAVLSEGSPWPAGSILINASQAFLAAHCWLMFHLMSTRTSKTSSVKLLSSWMPLSIFWCTRLFLPRCRHFDCSLWTSWSSCQHISPACWGTSGWHHGPLVYQLLTSFLCHK